MDNLVSIIMLSHNQAQFVEESVRSVMAQTYKYWELLNGLMKWLNYVKRI